VTLLTREVVTDLELELSKLRAERAQLEQQSAGAAPAVEPPQSGGRWPWGRGKTAAPPVAGENGAVDGASTVAWSVAQAMRPVADGLPGAAPGVAPVPAAPVSPAPRGRGSAVPQASVPPTPAKFPASSPRPANPAAPGALAPPAATPQSAPKSRTTPTPAPPKRRTPPPRRTPLSDSELDSVVAPLLAELANLRAEVRDLRGDPDSELRTRRPNHQTVKLVAGVLVGFALIVIALAVVLKA
jgi:hypothetical protein